MKVLNHTCIASVLFAVLALPMHAIEIPERVQKCLQISHGTQHNTEAESIVPQPDAPTSASSPSSKIITSSMTETYCQNILNNFLKDLGAQINDRSRFSATLGKAVAMRNFKGQDFGGEDEDADELTDDMPSDNGQFIENLDFLPELKDTVSSNMQRFQAENNEGVGLKLKSLLKPSSSGAPFYAKESWLKKLRHMKQVLESAHAQNSQSHYEDFTQGVEDAETTAASDQSATLENANMTPSKRATEGPWFNVIRKVVAKRRRQTLSINNALMALTDMLLSHGKEQLQRNRDNLRYHMYLQG